MTANYEARERSAYPSYEQCVQALAEVSAEVQQRRWELLVAAGPEETARQVWAPWMGQTEAELAARYARLLERAGAA